MDESTSSRHNAAPRESSAGALQQSLRRTRVVFALALGGVLLTVGVGVMVLANRAAHDLRQAEQARNQADEKSRQLEEALDQARDRGARAAANTHIPLAQVAWNADNPALAHRHLRSVPENLRFWEWHYLKAQFGGGGQVVLRVPEGAGLNVAFSADGQRLLSIGASRVVKLWDVATGKQLVTIEGQEAALSPDGRRIVTVISEKTTRTIKVWDVQSSKELLCVPAPGTSQWPLGLALSPNGEYLAGSGAIPEPPVLAGRGMPGLAPKREEPEPRLFPLWIPTHTGRGQVRIWEIATGKELDDLQGFTFAFSPDSQRIACATRDGSVLVKRLPPSGEPLVLKGHGQGLTHLLFGPNGRLIATAGFDRSAKLWDAQSGKALLSLPEHEPTIHKMAFSPDGSKLLTTTPTPTLFDWKDNPSGQVRIWDTTTGKLLTSFSGHEAAFSPDGRLLASCSNDHVVRIRSLTGGEEGAVHKGHSQHVFALAFRPDGDRVASASYDGTVRIWSTKPDNSKPPLKQSHAPLILGISVAYPFAMSPGGEFIAATVDPSTLKVWDARSGKEVFHFQGKDRVAFGADSKKIHVKDRIGSVAFRRDGKVLAIGGFRGPVELWDFSTKQKIATLEEWTDASSMAFSGDGRLVASSVNPGVAVWDRDGGKVMLGEQNWITSLAFSPDGRRLASGGISVIVWDVPAKKVAFTVQCHHFAHVHSLAFSPDGALLAAGNTDNNVQIWDANTGAELGRQHRRRAVHPQGARPLCRRRRLQPRRSATRQRQPRQDHQALGPAHRPGAAHLARAHERSAPRGFQRRRQAPDQRRLRPHGEDLGDSLTALQGSLPPTRPCPRTAVSPPSSFDEHSTDMN